MGVIKDAGMDVIIPANEGMVPNKAEQVNIDISDNGVEYALASYVKGVWEKLRDGQREVEEKYIRAANQRNGKYDADKKSALRAARSSEIYVRITATKCRAAEAWINDVLSPANERPWTLQPTPIPDLPDNVVKEAEDKALEEVTNLAVAYKAATGEPIHPAEFNQVAEDHHENIVEKVSRTIKDRAGNAAERMENKVADQLAEGGWHDAFVQVVSDAITYGTGIMKGPVFRKRPVMSWPSEFTEKPSPVVVDKVVMEFDRVSPFDVYFDKDIQDIHNGNLIQHHRFTRKDINRLIGMPGFVEKSITTVLDEYGKSGLKEHLPMDASRNEAENKPADTITVSDKIDVLEFWGSVQGRMIKELGISETIDDLREYEIMALVCGGNVLKVMLNPDPLGQKPYSIGVCEKIPGAIRGNGIPDIIEDVQEACNAFARAMINNAALASGPMAVVNVDMIEPGDDRMIYPWKIFFSSNKQMQEGKAVEFYQPNMNLNELVFAYKHFQDLADEVSGVPAYSYGMPDVKGTGGTASGLSMLMGSANRGIKQMIRNIDMGIIQPTITRVVNFNNAHDEDDTIKGDVHIQARGANALVAKELLQGKRQDFLNSVLGNELALQIVGLDGVASIMRKNLEPLDIPPEEIIPLSRIKQLRDQHEKQSPSIDIAGATQQGAQPMPGQVAKPGQAFAPATKKSPEMLAGEMIPVGGEQSGPTMATSNIGI